jgi:hypothetical protein
VRETISAGRVCLATTVLNSPGNPPSALKAFIAARKQVSAPSVLQVRIVCKAPLTIRCAHAEPIHNRAGTHAKLVPLAFIAEKTQKPRQVVFQVPIVLWAPGSKLIAQQAISVFRNQRCPLLVLEAHIRVRKHLSVLTAEQDISARQLPPVRPSVLQDFIVRQIQVSADFALSPSSV